LAHPEKLAEPKALFDIEAEKKPLDHGCAPSGKGGRVFAQPP
jgi:hypothetical protein